MTRPHFSAPRRLPAGALLLVLTVSVVVAAILLSLLLLAANRRQLSELDARRDRVRHNLFSGLAYARAYPELPPFQEHAVDLFGDELDSARILRKPWGLFDVVLVTAGAGGQRDTALALLGSTFSPVNAAALYLSDEHIGLAVNDDAQVQGGAWLPAREAVHPGNLPLTGPHRTGEAVTGRVRPSASALPVGGDSALARVRAYASLQLDELLPAGSQPARALPSSSYSFLGQPAVWYHAEPFTLRSPLAGQIVLVSSQRLLIEAGSTLDNVLVLAPTIIVQAGFRGRAQFIARDTVVIGDSCRLAYPSAACAYGARGLSLVQVGAGTHLQGVVLASATQPGLGCAVRLASTSVLEGQVFSAGVVENPGLVRGPLMCRRLLYHGVGSVYENYLVNATLDRAGLSPYFLSTRLLNPGGHSDVLAWLR